MGIMHIHNKKMQNFLSVSPRDRPMWYPGVQAPPHLDGKAIGDYGFDPLRLGVNTELLPWYKEAELTNGRWAMAAVSGILFTDLFGLGNWWEAGSKDYGVDLNLLLVLQLIVMTIFEAKRFENFLKTGEGGLLTMTPFDPCNILSDEMRLKEIKNARLAMVSFIGFASQAAVQGMGPIECLKKHIEDPRNENIFTSSVGLETTCAVVVLSITPIIIEAKKSLTGDEEDIFRPIPW